MEKNIIIGNVISMLSMIVIMIGGFVKSKSRFMVVQFFHNILCVVCNVFLSAPTAVITASTGCARDFLTYKNKMTFRLSVVVAVITVIASVVCNGGDLFGYLPLIATVPYAFLIVKANDIQTKILTIYIMLLWCVYDFGICNYVGGAFDLITIATSITGIVRIRDEERENACRLEKMLADII